MGTRQPNPWGLYDMHGNVDEWCFDVYDSKLPGGQDPLVSLGGSVRVFRGGSWFNTAGNCLSAYRNGNTPDSRHDGLGFRLARSSGP